MVVGVWFVLMFSTVALHFGDKNAPPTAFLAFFPLIWLFFAGCGILNLVIAIVYAIKAGQGEWAEYPLLGRLARKMLKIGPVGAPLSAQA